MCFEKFRDPDKIKREREKEIQKLKRKIQTAKKKHEAWANKVDQKKNELKKVSASQKSLSQEKFQLVNLQKAKAEIQVRLVTFSPTENIFEKKFGEHFTTIEKVQDFCDRLSHKKCKKHFVDDLERQSCTVKRTFS